MQKFTFFVGLDVSKATFAVCFLFPCGQQITQLYHNTGAGIALFISDLLAYHPERSQVLIGFEHCGGYIEKLVMALYEAQLFVWVWNPYLAKHAPLELTRHKDDPTDAKSMSELLHLYRHKAKAYLPDTEEQRKLKDLFRLRKQLIKDRARTYNYQASNLDKAIPDPTTTQTHRDLIQFYCEKIEQVEKQLKELINSSQRLKRIYQILLSIPSIGPITASQMIEITHAFTRFESEKQLAKFIGTMPLKYESGSSINRKPRVSKKAHKSLKVYLTLGAVSAIKPKAFFHQFYQYKTQTQNIEHFKVINSIRNMVIKLAFKLVKDDQCFEPDFFLKNKKSWQKFLHLS